MIGEKSVKGSLDSAVHPNLGHVSSKEPLVERAKRKRTRGIIKKVMLAGLVGLSALMFRPATLTAQQVTMNAPSGKIAEQTTKIHTNNVSSCGVTLDYINEKMQKLTDQNDISLMNVIFDNMKTDEGQVISGTDTIMGIIGGKVYNVILTPQSEQMFRQELNLTHDEYISSVESDALKYYIAVMDEKKTNFPVNIRIINGNKVVGKDNTYKGTKIEVSFIDKNNKNKLYASVFECPEGCKVPEIIPFFGRTQGNEIQFGIYYRYIQNGVEQKMIGYIFYDTSKGSAIISYVRKDFNKGLSFVGLPFNG